MRCGFSEFTYGFALTYEVTNLVKASLGAIPPPVLPNLVQEGTLGYDVRMDGLEGWTWLAQFKLPSFLVRSSAKEWAEFGHSYFRFTTREDSKQHALLLDLEAASVFNMVQYCTPMFDSSEQLAACFNAGTVDMCSLKMKPSEIGEGDHVISYDSHGYVVVHSEPQRMQLRTASTVEESRSLWQRELGIAPRRLTLELLEEAEESFMGSAARTLGDGEARLVRTVRQQTRRSSSGLTETGARFEDVSRLAMLTLGAQLMFIPSLPTA